MAAIAPSTRVTSVSAGGTFTCKFVFSSKYKDRTSAAAMDCSEPHVGERERERDRERERRGSGKASKNAMDRSKGVE
jgi:hypothetical protein